MDRVLSAAFGDEARPDAGLRRATLAEMVRLQSSLLRREAETFPDAALMALGSVLAACAVVLAVRLAGSSGPQAADVASAALVLANLVAAPLAAVIIVMRRRYA